MSIGRNLVAGWAVLACVSGAIGQASQYALRFYGTGIGPPGQQDRVRIQIDDNAGGADASAPCDVGAGSFTVEFWMRGHLADNSTASVGSDVEVAGPAWINGNIIVDRDIWGNSSADWGVSIADGRVAFGTGFNGNDPESTIVGGTGVLDGVWHHIALVRDASTGLKHIYVDGQLDFSSVSLISNDNISYPNAGVSVSNSPWNPYIVLGAEKHDAGAAFPSYAGYFDELRIWNTARTQSQILNTYDRVISGNSSGLVAYYRFEAGSGTAIVDSSSANSPTGQLIAGTGDNGEWVSFASSALNTAPVSNGPLPAGFAKTTVAQNLAEPTVIAFAPDGRMFIAQRGGTILVHENGAVLPAPLITIPVDTLNGERGVIGMTLDPNFASNGYIYFFYTTTEPRNRVGRFTVVGNTASLASELAVWQCPDLAPFFHAGGGLGFGNDGNLYISTGDQTVPANAQSLSNQHGKMLRVTPTGGIPAGNPFGASPIWAYGLRNPFRFSIDSLTGNIWIANVGGNTDDSWEEVNLGVSGANYGWPNQEGPECFITNCAAYTFPHYWYQHSDPTYYNGGFQASITGGPVYRATAFPAPYRGNLYFGDYANRWIRRLVFDAAGQVVGDPVFFATPNAGTIVDLKIGPDGALYYVNFGVGWNGVTDSPAVYRIAYTGVANIAPVAVAGASPMQGGPPLNVQFSSAGSYDPDHGPSTLAYDWDFGDGDGSNLPNPQHSYATTGTYVARLTVDDGANQTESNSLTITAGNPPVATIAQPPAGTTYSAGDTINFAGTGEDSEDGTLPASAFSWNIVLVHSGHTHPFLGPINGVSSGSFQIPTTGHGPANTHFEIQLAVSDSDSLTGSASRPVNPVISQIQFDTVPSGIPIFLDGDPLPTPTTYNSIPNFQHTIEAQSSYTLSGTAYEFRRWSDNGARVHDITVPAGGTTRTAIYGVPLQSTIVVSVEADDRNADHWPPTGQQYYNFYDSFGLCFGQDSGGVFQTGLEFALPVPPSATIISASIEMTATNDQLGSPNAAIWCYDVADAPAFDDSVSTPLTAFAPLTGATLSWNPPAFTAGLDYSTPDLSTLVQEVVDRPDWNNGNFIAFVIDGVSSGNEDWHCLRNYQSGDAARLSVTFSIPCDPCDADCNGSVNPFDIQPFVNDLSDGGASPCSPCASDIDGNGSVNPFDINGFLDCLTS